MARVPKSSPFTRVAIVYDRLNSWGGAERVLLHLRKLYPQAVLFSSVYDTERAAWAKDFSIKTSFLQKWSWARTHHQWFGWLMPLAFETVDLSEFELIISVTSEAAKGVVTRPDQLHICYLLTPTRYLWSHQREYRNSLPAIIRPLARRMQTALQHWDRVAAQRPDSIVPISAAVRARCTKYYARDTEAPLYPGYSELPPAQAPSIIPRQPFVFSWGRHVSYKRFDLVIEAAKRLNIGLVIAGEGPQTRQLQKRAENSHTAFVGRISDAELAWYLQHAECAIFPQVEDFGIAPLEALSQGCPVVLHQESGVAELFQPGEGVTFIRESTAEEIAEAVRRAQSQLVTRLDIQSRARQYAEESFQSNWEKKVQMLWQQHQQQLKGSV